MSHQRGVEEPDDPIGYFLEDIEYQGKSKRTRTSYERVLREFESFLGEKDTADGLASISYRDCMSWIHSLRGTHAESSIATYASYLHRFYSYMVQVGVFESNPMTVVMEEMDESIHTDPTRRDIPVSEMRGFIGALQHPLHRAVIVTLLKTGMRSGELCNLDVRDVNLDGVALDDAGFDEVRPQLQGKPDSIYVSQEPAQGEVLNGEERSASNKRKRATIVPVDPELKRTLRQWLAVRPDPSSPANPLFVTTARNWGDRVTIDAVHHLVTTNTDRMGWYRTGGGPEENVTPHYFRHFFTTHLRDRTGDRGIVKYLRGDVASDIIDTYTHNWGTRVRDTYEEHIYELF
ncbi:tyrosine-type recombinase/integrase [Halorientalis brevis]|uniref:Tyrosine-type recombinase/integrase n=1 Tax=Halorientalis brevis TaxID=1126241 RepID=A0ABD6CE83_9EURY|nr:tyrosine-type recombinase/integrase [Halorientalis brevis]